MTPLAILLTRFIPRAWVSLVMVIIYSAMMLGLLLASVATEIDIAYVNVNKH